MSDIGERVKKIVVEHLGVEPEKVTDNASFIDDQPAGPTTDGPPVSHWRPGIQAWSTGHEASCRHRPRHGVATRLWHRRELETHP